MGKCCPNLRKVNLRGQYRFPWLPEKMKRSWKKTLVVGQNKFPLLPEKMTRSWKKLI